MAGATHDVIDRRTRVRNFLPLSADPSFPAANAHESASRFSLLGQTDLRSISVEVSYWKSVPRVSAVAPSEHRFRLLRCVHEGQHRAVYEADDLREPRTLALKVARDRDDRTVAQLRREAEILGRLRHPHIVPLAFAGTAPDIGYFVATPFLNGRSLDRVIADHPRVPDGWRRALMKQLLDALSAIHAAGGVHADVTPANCFCVDFESFDEPPRLMLLDLGASRWPDDDDENGRAITPVYTSPEQARGEAPTPASDLYSAAVLAYELLTGVPPFRASTSTEVLWQHLHERPPPPVGLTDPETSFACALHRALDKDPAARFASAAELAAALALDRAEPATARVAPDPSQLEPSAIRRTLAARVREHWIEGVLSRSTEGVILVNQVVRRADALVADSSAEIGEETTGGIGAAFEDSERALLLLGDVGHGKTVNLLRLARRLLDETANVAQGRTPIPVVLALSAWSGEDDLVEWMASELSAKYLVPRRTAAALFDGGELLPLLDGLDEVPVTLRERCIDAINRFHRRYPSSGIVVSCRLDDYAQSKVPVRLRGAVVLQKLRPQEIGRQLRAAAQTELLEAITKSEVLEELAQTPILLHVMRVALRDSTTFRELLSDPTNVVRTLFERFTNVVCQSYGTDERLLHEPLRRAAILLRRSGKTLLLLEDVQPSWLESSRDRTLYVVVTRPIAATLFAASIVLAMGLSPIDNAGFHTSLAFSLRLAATTAVVLTTVYSIDALVRFRRPPPSSSSIPWRLARALLCGAIAGAVIGGVAYLGEGHRITFDIGVQCGLLGALVLGLSRKFGGDPTREVSTVERMHWALRNFTFRRVALLALFAATMFFVKRSDDGTRAAAYDAFTVGLLGLGILGFRTEALEEKLVPNIGILLTARNAALAFIATFVAATAVFGVSYGLAYGACVALTLGVVMSLWLGGVDVINHYVLRLFLHRRNALRLRATEKFDVAVRLGLMRRVGSGFMFMHGLLLEHFASSKDEGAT